MGTSLINKDTKLSDMFKLLKELKIDQEQEINILLLGGTGIGKSTFVNALANYLTYKKLSDVEQEKLMVLIPCSFNIEDKNHRFHRINVDAGTCKNECLDVGASATQDVKTYIFPIGNGKTKLRIIDSPGIGDTRGLEQDKINCENILSYLGQLEKLHAICCMFSTSNSRIDVFFEYCFKEILSRLDKSATNNLIFVFTNSRASNFTPGETMSVLRKLAEDIEKNPPHVKIPLENKNIFCFENDCFKYLAAMKNKVEFDDYARKLYKESWKQSAKECWRMIGYIVGDNQNNPLAPHDIRNTVSINEVRRLIVNLSMPLADISQNIDDNIHILERHKQYLQTHTTSIEDMKKKLYIPVVNLKVITLTQPVTVCASSKCAEIYTVGGIKKWHYKQRCHDPCYLRNVPHDIVGTPELINCAAMDGTKTCKRCSCDFSAHLHVYYFTETVDDTIEDEAIKDSIRGREDALRKIQRFVQDTEERKKGYEEERKLIIKYTAQFAVFLSENAIVPYNDSYQSYIEYMINREQLLGRNAEQRKIDELNYLLRQYKETKRSYQIALDRSKAFGNEISFNLLSPQTIKQSIEKLYGLKYSGKDIKRMVDSQKTARSREYEKTSEYVHSSPGNMFADWGSDSKKTNATSVQQRFGSRENNERQGNRDQGSRGRGNSKVRAQNRQNYSERRNFAQGRGDNRNQQHYQQAPPPYDATFHNQQYRGYNQQDPRYGQQHQWPQGQHCSSPNQFPPKIEVNVYPTPKCGFRDCNDPRCAGIQSRPACGDMHCHNPHCNPTYNPGGYSSYPSTNPQPSGYNSQYQHNSGGYSSYPSLNLNPQPSVYNSQYQQNYNQAQNKGGPHQASGQGGDQQRNFRGNQRRRAGTNRNKSQFKHVGNRKTGNKESSNSDSE